MHTKSTSPGKSKLSLLAWIIGLTVMVIICVTIGYSWFLMVIDEGGVFTLTFSPVDLDLDGDLDVLVHNRRNPGEFEVFAGGALWINQGGIQGGRAGQLVYQRNEIEGGLASTTAELNGDGEPDVLIFDGNRLILGLNQGGEQWKEGAYFRKSALIAAPLEQQKKFGQASQYATLVVGDVDKDGRVDALVLGCCGRAFKVREEDPDIPNFSWIWFNDVTVNDYVAGDVASLDALEGVPVGGAALADLDEDGDLDLVIVSLKSLTKTGAGPAGMILLNDGDGHFSVSGQHLSSAGASSLALGDLDHDDDPDILIGDERGAGVWINQGGLQGGQAGTFSASEHPIAGSQTRSVVLDDLDSDGDLDALVVGKRRAALWWNDGQGHFTQAGQSFPCSERQNLTTGDFNGDGWEDIFIAKYDKTSQVWFNNGKGGFRTGIH